MNGLTYKDAGVDIEAANTTVNRMTSHVKKTFTSDVLTGLGSFGSLYSLKHILNTYDHPILVQSIDGVGTKTKVAVQCGNFTNLGYDLFSAAVNDIVVMGAKPLTFLDYVAHDKLQPQVMEQLVSGMATACAECGVSLVGGETAEMPGVYVSGEIDMVGVVSGVVDKHHIISGATISEGDVVYGLTSSGLHTNGYSLARKVFFEVANNHHTDTYPALNGATVGEALLAPHINYTNIIRAFLDSGLDIKGMAHITGGGFVENIPRILPKGLGVKIQRGTWDILPIFTLMQHIAHIGDDEMYRCFNMGIGMVIVGDKTIGDMLTDIARAYPETAVKTIGTITPSGQVDIV